jgi:2-dehydro-3-deoxyphosphogluconate aldolase/(4S)-4-hydroxy-2-oxoglutarate aldolase
MHHQSKALTAIKQQGILPMFFNANATVSTNILKALYRAGMRVIEFTNRGAEALDVYKRLKAERDESFPDMLIGVGTIKTVDDAHKFIDAGTDFVVAPGTIAEVGRVVVQAGLLWSPGCMTVTEIMVAEENGSQLIKLFPGSLLGPSYIGAVREIFPKISFMPTGGVEPERDSISAWFKAGACAVGMGSKLVSKPLMETERYDTIEERARQVLDIITNYRRQEAEKAVIAGQ